MAFVRRSNPLKNLCLCCRISRESANFHRWGPIRRFRILTACFDIGKGESNSCALTLAEFPFFPLFAFERRQPVCTLQSVNNKNSAKLRWSVVQIRAERHIGRSLRIWVTTPTRQPSKSLILVTANRVVEFKKCKFFARKGKSTVNPGGLASILTHYCGKFA